MQVSTPISEDFPDDQKLSSIALKWIVEEAVAQGMIVKTRKYATECKVTPEFAEGRLHKNAWPWVLLGTRRRPIPRGACVHSSVQARISADHGYDPIGATQVTWVDGDWATHAK